jgi:cysteine synthase A
MDETISVNKQRWGVSPSVLRAIGNTPVIPLSKIVPPNSAQVVLKLESLNPTGSYKDRMALSMIEEAEVRGDLRAGMTVVEYTGGSTGTSLAFICAVKGYPFRAVTSDAFAREKLQSMRAFGADLEIIPSDGGKITRGLIESLIARAREIASGPSFYWTDQFRNTDAQKGYEVIGRELTQQVEGRIHAFCGGVGTAGMLMGVARAFRAANAQTRIVALEPASSAVISTGKSGSHRIEGIGSGFVPPMLNKNHYDESRGIEESEARQIARRLAREEGIFVGTSSGLNVVGALQLAKELGPGHLVATVAVDTGLKYLAGDLFDS